VFDGDIHASGYMSQHKRMDCIKIEKPNFHPLIKCVYLHYGRMEINNVVMRVLMCDSQGKWDAERQIKHFFVSICLFLCFHSLSLHISLHLLLTYGLAERCIYADDKPSYLRLK
jgi:hypothetical protein